jgi:hypothetical protein
MPLSPPPPVSTAHPGLVRESIALLSDEEVRSLDRRDLVDLIRLAGLTRTDDAELRLRYATSEEACRIAFLARRCCQNQLNSYHQGIGRPALWVEAI